MGPEFHYPTRDIQIWTPLTINPADFQTRTGYAHLTVARLKPGVTMEQAQIEVGLIATRLAQQYPQVNQEVRFRVRRCAGTWPRSRVSPWSCCWARLLVCCSSVAATWPTCCWRAR
jgi:hypothetical protein